VARSVPQHKIAQSLNSALRIPARLLLVTSYSSRHLILHLVLH